MARRKNTKEIMVDASTIVVKDIIAQGKNAPIELRVAAVAILKNTIGEVQGDLSQLKRIEEEVSHGIETTEYDSLIKKMISDGILSSDDEKPVFVIKGKDGSKMTVTMSAGHDDQFEVDPSISAKSTLDIIPDQYKKVNITLDKKAIEADFNAGVLPTSIARFCSKNPIDITKLKVAVQPKEKTEGGTK